MGYSTIKKCHSFEGWDYRKLTLSLTLVGRYIMPSTIAKASEVWLTLSLPSTSKNQNLSAKHVSRTPEY